MRRDVTSHPRASLDAVLKELRPLKADYVPKPKLERSKRHLFDSMGLDLETSAIQMVNLVRQDVGQFPLGGSLADGSAHGKPAAVRLQPVEWIRV